MPYVRVVGMSRTLSHTSYGMGNHNPVGVAFPTPCEMFIKLCGYTHNFVPFIPREKSKIFFHLYMILLCRANVNLRFKNNFTNF